MKKRIAAMLLTLAVSVTFMPSLALTSFGLAKEGKPTEKPVVEVTSAHVKLHVSCKIDYKVDEEVKKEIKKDIEAAAAKLYANVDGGNIYLEDIELGNTLDEPDNLGVKGYVIDHWFLEHKDESKAFDFSQPITKEMIKMKENQAWLELHACWVPQVCVVKFQDGTNGNELFEMPVLANDTIDPIDAPDKAKYDFLGWYNGNHKWDFEKDTVSDMTELTLVAKYAPVDTLVAKSVASGKKAVKTSWTAVKGAKYYVVKGNYCGKKAKTLCKKTYKTTFTKKSLKKGKKYKVTVYAYNAAGKKIATAPTTHTIIGKVSGKYANVSKVAASKTSVTLAMGATQKVTAKYTMAKKGKNVLYKHHCAKYRYITSNSSVATFSNGTIKAVGAGSCFVYVVAPNGAYSRTTVNVPYAE